MNFVDINNDYLSYSMLDLGADVECIAYVTSTKTSISSIKSEYSLAFLKTVDDYIVQGTYFNNLKGSKGSFFRSLENCFVKVKGVVDEHNGKYTIIIQDIEKIETTPELITKFTSVVDNLEILDEGLEGILQDYGIESQKGLKSKVYVEIENNRIGGIVKYIYDILTTVEFKVKDELKERAVALAYYTIINYTKYLDTKRKIVYDLDYVKIEFLHNLPRYDKVNPVELVSTVGYILGICKPNTLVTATVIKSIDYVNTMNSLNDSWNLLVEGSESECEGIKLIKY